MRFRTAAAIAAVIAVMTAAWAAAQTTIGVAVGATVPTGIPASVMTPNVSVSGWVSGPVAGPFGWRAEFTRGSLAIPEAFEIACEFAGVVCRADLSVTTVGGGLQFEPWDTSRVAPYGYLTVGWHHVGASATLGSSERTAFSGWGWPGRLADGSLRPFYGTTRGIFLSGSWNENAAGAALGLGVRVRLDKRWALRAELRYSGFAFGGGAGWSSWITPGLNVSVRF